jgi:hypothetical protein
LDRTVQLDQFCGTQIAGTLKVSEAALNELLDTKESPLPGATISVAPDNEVVFRYGVFRARVTLVPWVEVGATPRIRLQLASLLVRLALSRALRQPYIRVSGREVTISLAAVPALHGWREVWPYIKSAGLRTDGGAIVIDFTFSMTE